MRLCRDPESGEVDGTIRIFLAARALFLGGGYEFPPSCRWPATQGVNTKGNFSVGASRTFQLGFRRSGPLVITSRPLGFAHLRFLFALARRPPFLATSSSRHLLLMIRASIIIPTCNRPGDLERCVGTLLPQLPADGSVEIRVCDDSSGDDSKRMLAAEFPSVAWNQGPRKGPAANRNLGGKLSESEWLIFIDDDCVPREGYVAAYLHAFVPADSSGLFHGLTFPLPEPTSLLHEAPSIKGPQSVFGSCNFAIRKKLFDENGGFDERYFPAFEDIEFFSRLRRLGTNAQCVWGAAVDHPLRPIPNSRKLAGRWEARVVSAMDLGATPLRYLHEASKACAVGHTRPISWRETHS